MTPELRSRFSRGLHYFSIGFFCIATLALIVPFEPGLPMIGLDASWQFAINQAVAQHLAFGRDIVFTFGPYASIYSRAYHPGTDALMLWGSAFFWAAYVFAILLLARGLRSTWLLVYTLLLAATAFSGDPLFFTYPLAVALVTFRLTLPESHSGHLKLSAPATRAVAALFLPLGLLPLIKGSFLLLTAGVAIACFVIFRRRQQRFLAWFAIVAPLLTAAVLWLLAGQPPAVVPQYVLSLLPIVSGYSEAMALWGRSPEILMSLIVGALLLWLVFSSAATAAPDSRLFLAAACALLVFVAFKVGLVRHDDHALITVGTTALATVLAAALFPGRRGLVVAALACLAWYNVAHDRQDSFRSHMDGLADLKPLTNAWSGLERRLGEGESLRVQYDRRLAEIRRVAPLPELPGTTDIYAYQQSALIASKNVWAPRPVLQSYSAYTADLARRDADYLRQQRAPDNILFRVETIDRRYPSLDDGPSWPALLENYRLRAFAGEYAVLQKRAEPGKPVLGPITQEAKHRLGEPVPLPDAGAPVYAEMEFTPTLVGRLLAFLFKPRHLTLSVVLDDGIERRFRIVSGMAKAGFVLSPLVEDTRDFVLLAGKDTGYLPSRAVRAISVAPSAEDAIFWQPSYTLRLRTLDLRAPEAVIPTAELFDPAADARRLSALRQVTVDCEGEFTSVNAASPKTARIHAAALLSVEGWTLARGWPPPDEVFVTLAGENGPKLYFQARTPARVNPDRKFDWLNPSDRTFRSYIDISALHGDYTLGLARRFRGNLQDCTQFRVPLQIGR